MRQEMAHPYIRHGVADLKYDILSHLGSRLDLLDVGSEHRESDPIDRARSR